MISIYRFCFIWFMLVCFLSGYMTSAQEKGFVAIIPPFHDRFSSTHSESDLQLVHQRFIIFVYRNAVAVYSEASFLNTQMDSISQELSLPSTGYVKNGNDTAGMISNGILGLQLWIEGERTEADFITDGNEDWYTMHAQFAPGEQKKLKALFWVQTSLLDIDSIPGLDTIIIADGKRSLLLDLSHAAVWKGLIESIDVIMILKDGLNPDQRSFATEPDSYDLQDSTLTWNFINVEPSADNDISFTYSSIGKNKSTLNTLAKLSAFIVPKVYDQLIEYVDQLDE